MSLDLDLLFIHVHTGKNLVREVILHFNTGRRVDLLVATNSTFPGLYRRTHLQLDALYRYMYSGRECKNDRALTGHRDRRDRIFSREGSFCHFAGGPHF